MKRTLFSLMLLFGLLITPATGAMAQPEAGDQTYTSQITGDEIDLGTSGQITWLVDDFDFRETPSFQEEYIWFTYGWSNFQMVLIDGPNDSETYHLTTLGNMERFYESWELLGEGITDDSSWFLGAAVFDGSPLIVYYEFELDAFGSVDMAFLQFTDASTFQRDLEVIQDEVTIGGEPILQDTDAAELAILAGTEPAEPDSSPEVDDGDEATGRTSRSSRDSSDTTSGDEAEEEGTTPSRSSRDSTDTSAGDKEADDEAETTPSRSSRGSSDATTDEDADDEAGTTPSRSSRGGSDATTDDEADNGNTSETSGTQSDRESRTGRLGTSTTTDDPDAGDDETDSTPVTGGDWSDMGLVSDSEWQSPTHGNVVTWESSMWAFPHDFDNAIIVSDDPPYDVLTLETVDGLGYVYITIDLPYESTPRNLIEYWVTEDYTSQIGSNVTIVETGTTSTSATMVYETTNSLDQPLVVVLEATFLDDGRVVFSQISGAPERIPEVYAQYLDGVQIDGTPLEMTFTVEEIQEITGN